MNVYTSKPEISIVLPCRDEEQALGLCLEQIKKIIADNNLNAEVIVSDSSSDKSPEIARDYGVILVSHSRDGYGAAYQEGFKIAQGKYLFGADPDGSYDFAEITGFISELKNGADFVIGNRLSSSLESDAMPWLHRYIGTPLLTCLTRLLFGVKVSDSQCGMRAWTREALDDIDARSPGMEYASEMIIKAKREARKISELPISYKPRLGQSKLNTFSDGWRHLKLIMLLWLKREPEQFEDESVYQ